MATDYLEGKSVEEIAESLHRSPFAIAWKLLVRRDRPVLAQRDAVLEAVRTAPANEPAPAAIVPDVVAAYSPARSAISQPVVRTPGTPAGLPVPIPQRVPSPTDPPTVAALDILERYASGESPDAIAMLSGLNKRAVLNALLDALFADVDTDLAGGGDHRPFDAEERARAESDYRRHKPIGRIAKALRRSPRDVAVQLLESPRRPVVVPRRLLRTLRADQLGAMPDDSNGSGEFGRTLADAVKEAHSEGLTISQIADRFVVDIPTVMLILASTSKKPAIAQEDAGFA
jgi:hypothetical protein